MIKSTFPKFGWPQEMLLLSVDASMKRLEKMIERKSVTEAALKIPFCQDPVSRKKLNLEPSEEGESKRNLAKQGAAACPEALKKLADMSNEVKPKEEELLATISSL